MKIDTRPTNEVLIVERRGELPRVLASIGPLCPLLAEGFASGFNTRNPARRKAIAVIHQVSEAKGGAA